MVDAKIKEQIVVHQDHKLVSKLMKMLVNFDQNRGDMTISNVLEPDPIQDEEAMEIQ